MAATGLRGREGCVEEVFCTRGGPDGTLHIEALNKLSSRGWLLWGLQRSAAGRAEIIRPFGLSFSTESPRLGGEI